MTDEFFLLEYFDESYFPPGYFGTGQKSAAITFVEFEVPDTTDPRKAVISFAELEVPEFDKAAQVSFAELEVPSIPDKGIVSFAELTVPDVATVGGPGDIIQLCGLVMHTTPGFCKIGVYALITSSDAARPDTKMQVERCSGASCTGFTLIGTTPFVKYPDAEFPQDEFIDFGPLLVPGTYRYRARLVNDDGFGAYSSPFEIETSLNGSSGCTGGVGSIFLESALSVFFETESPEVRESALTVLHEHIANEVRQSALTIVHEEQRGELRESGLMIIYEYDLIPTTDRIGFRDTPLQLIDRFDIIVPEPPGPPCEPTPPWTPGPCPPPIE